MEQIHADGTPGAEGSDRTKVEMDSTRNLRIFVALALVAFTILPFGRSLFPSVRGVDYTAGPVFHVSAGRFFAIEYDTSLWTSSYGVTISKVKK